MIKINLKPSRFELINNSSIPWDTPAEGVRVKVIERGNKQLRLIEFSKDFVERDWCVSGHIGYVLDGQLNIDFNGTSVLYNPRNFKNFKRISRNFKGQPFL